MATELNVLRALNQVEELSYLLDMWNRRDAGVASRLAPYLLDAMLAAGL